MKKFLLFLAMLVWAFVGAQDGGLDTSFGNNGVVQTDIDGDRDLGISITQQMDGRLLVAGQFNIQGQEFPSIARFNLNGSIDPSFGNNGVAVFNRTGYEYEYYRKVLSQSDGKIVANGIFSVTANYQFVINRFLTDGSIDTSFGNNGELIVFPEQIATGEMTLLNDDSLLVVGRIFENGISKIGLKKYLSDGTLDTSFGNNGVVITAIGDESSAQKVLITRDNKIVVLAGMEDNGEQSQVLLRYLLNGTVDSSFGNNGLVNILNEPDFSSQNIAIYEDGKILVHSSFVDWYNERINNLIFRFLPDGSFDTSFSSNGYLNPNRGNLSIRKVEIQPNQRLLIFGELTNFLEGGGPFFIKRYHLGGHLDTSFNFITNSYDNFVADMLIQQDGKITCLANTAWYNGQEDIILERHFNTPLSVSEFDYDSLKIYPNPSSGIFTIERELFSENTPFQITDITGKIIVLGELTEKQSQINLTAAQSGVYFLKTSNSVFRLLKN
tara:strand:+ start:1176 stop:2663 length:1488 start_codon:yes stop_codon:yes gene_type:complete